jgi:hypothetical protein
MLPQMNANGICYLIALLCAGSSITLAILRFVEGGKAYDASIGVVAALGAFFGLLPRIIDHFRTHRSASEPENVLQHRLEMEAKFKAEFQTNFSDGYAPRVIIRDLQRMDKYPDTTPNRRRISAWARMELKGLYERGIELYYEIVTIKHEEVDGAWRLADHDEENTETGAVLARIPYEFINRLNPNGDCYYPEPHIFCAFKGIGGTAFQELVLYRIVKISGGDVFMPLGPVADAQRLYDRWKRIADTKIRAN